MTPQTLIAHRLFRLGRLSLVALAALCGCTSQVVLPTDSGSNAAAAQLTVPPEDEVTLIKDLAQPWGTSFIKLEGVALVTGLEGTGSDPPPSTLRTTLISEMETHEVKNPNQILASPNTSLVLIRAFLPPGVRKGDHFDIEVLLPSRSETTSLRGGWLMRTRLREVAVLNNSLHTGRVSGLAEGNVLVDAVFDGAEDKVGEVRGRVLGGGTSLASRPLGLEVQTENRSVRTSALVGAAINARFHTFDHGVKKGVATPKRDNFIELDVHPRYQQNLARYMRVVRNIAFTESPTDRIRRMETLERQLRDPATAANVALQLEAIGKEAIPILHKATRSDDRDVRFYAAEALALHGRSGGRGTPGRGGAGYAGVSLARDRGAGGDGACQRPRVAPAVAGRAQRGDAVRGLPALRTRNPQDPVVRGTPTG